MNAETVGVALLDDTYVDVACETYGPTVDNGSVPSDVWAKLTDGTFLPTAFLLTGYDGRNPSVPECGQVADVGAESTDAGSGYDSFERLQAAEEARDTAFVLTSLIGTECTLFVSLALWGGGLPSSEEWSMDSPDTSLWASRRIAPGVTKAAANADFFVRYFEESGRGTVTKIEWSDNTASGAELGDVIAYDWDNGADGIMDHVAIVTGFNDDGFPVVSQRTPAQVDRFWSWSEGENWWIEYAYPGSKAYLVHISS